MAWIPQELRGSLFPNKQKKSATSPDHMGEAMIDGTIYRVSAWTKKGPYGEFLSLALQVKPAAPVQDEPAKAKPKEVAVEFSDDVPF